MRDRDTQYRWSQSTALACAFDLWFPGSDACPLPDTHTFADYMAQLRVNGSLAGTTLESLVPNYFGSPELPFFLSEAQVGKVRGDSFETICYAVLWNECQKISGKSVGVVSLGDNFDLKRLLVPESAEVLERLQLRLQDRGLSLSYSTPDILLIDLTDHDVATRQYFAKPVTNLGLDSQALLKGATGQLLGRVSPKDIWFAVGIKTSLRSDRMFQFLFEANAWKFMWRRVFHLEPSAYFALTTQTFGANPERLSSLDFSDPSPETAARAIDAVSSITCPGDVKSWFREQVAKQVTLLDL